MFMPEHRDCHHPLYHPLGPAGRGGPGARDSWRLIFMMKRAVTREARNSSSAPRRRVSSSWSARCCCTRGNYRGVGAPCRHDGPLLLLPLSGTPTVPPDAPFPMDPPSYSIYTPMSRTPRGPRGPPPGPRSARSRCSSEASSSQRSFAHNATSDPCESRSPHRRPKSDQEPLNTTKAMCV